MFNSNGKRVNVFKLIIATAVTLHLAFYFGKPLFMPKHNVKDKE